MIQLGRGDSIRQRTINLVYLIMLAFVFTFIPSDFVDSMKDTDESINMLCQTIEEQNGKHALMVLNYLKEDKVLFEEIKLSVLAVDKHTQRAIEYIESLKLKLMGERGFNKHGFLNGAKREMTSAKIMIKDHNADSLFKTLSTYKQYMVEILPIHSIERLDSILPLSEFRIKSNGDLIESDMYYFGRTPLSATILNLSHFRSRLEQIRNYATKEIVLLKIESKKNETPFLDLQLIENQEDRSKNEKVVNKESETENDDVSKEGENQDLNSPIGARTDYITSFFDLLEQKQGKLEKEEKEPSYLFVESQTDSIYSIGQPMRFNVGFDTNETKKVSVFVSDLSGRLKSFVMRKPGLFMYVPPEKGLYTVSFRSEEITKTKSMKVIDAEPVLQNDKMGVLFIGMDNALNIETSMFKDTEGLIARISSGEILKKGKHFYARVLKKEVVNVEVFAKMEYGFVKIATKSFAVRDLINPYPAIANYKNGETIPRAELDKLKSLDIVSTEYLINEKFYVSDFQFTIIYNNHTAILKPINQIGATLNATASDALSRVKSGDILIFEKIRTKSSLGNVKEIAPLTLIVGN